MFSVTFSLNELEIIAAAAACVGLTLYQHICLEKYIFHLHNPNM